MKKTVSVKNNRSTQQAARLAALRQLLARRKVEGFIVPTADEYQGEYTPARAKRLEWLTGFSGSAGMAVVLAKKAALFTDGRYTLQAVAEVGEAFYELHNSGALTPEQWIASQAREGARIGYDPWLHTHQAVERMEAACRARGITLAPLAENPLDAVWKDQPPPPCEEVTLHPLEYSGEDAAAKRKRCGALVKAKGADVAVLSLPESIMWLLNLRGGDVPMTPFALSFALLEASGKVRLYIDARKLSAPVKTYLKKHAAVRASSDIGGDLDALGKVRVLYDPAMSAAWFRQRLTKAGAQVIHGQDPCLLPKACKNPVEQEGARQAHIRDGAAVVKFLCWLDEQVKARAKSLTELSVAEKLEALRAEHPLFRGLSFNTIAGSGPNGAIVHYRASEATDRPIEPGLFLLDSGAQYPDGTTDITRTIAVGRPSAEQKENFTRVLKGHIALARAVFPEGTSGSQLDVLARAPLWEAGLDYDHGTGHGVGSYLSVHEGPQRIGKRGGDQPLMAGMILSNEPGYYKAGGYGIRIENLVLVQPYRARKAGSGKAFFCFETLTLVPIDTRAILPDMLTAEEKDWLNEYHRRVYRTLLPLLGKTAKTWLKERCASV